MSDHGAGRPLTSNWPTICYLLLSHERVDDVYAVALRIRRLDPTCLVVIDFDGAATCLSALDDDRVILRNNPRPGGWGGWGLVDRVLNTATWTLAHHHFDWLLVASGDSYPVQSLHGLADALGRSEEDFFVSSPVQVPLRLPSAADVSKRYDFARYHYAWFRVGGDRLRHLVGGQRGAALAFRVSAIQPLVFLWPLPRGHRVAVGVRRRRTPFSPDFRCWKASQWMTLSRRAVLRVVSYAETHPEVVRHYRRSLIPDESFIVSVLMNDADLRHGGPGPVFAAFDRGHAAHARDLDESHLAMIRASGQPFARKVHGSSPARLIAELDAMSDPAAAD